MHIIANRIAIDDNKLLESKHLLAKVARWIQGDHGWTFSYATSLMHVTTPNTTDAFEAVASLHMILKPII